MSYRKIGVAPVQPRCSETTPRISSLSALPRFFGEDGREGRQPVYWETWTESSIQTWSGSCAGAKDAMLRAGKEAWRKTRKCTNVFFLGDSSCLTPCGTYQGMWANVECPFLSLEVVLRMLSSLTPEERRHGVALWEKR